MSQDVPQKPTDDELAQKYADEYLWIQNKRDYEGWGDDGETRRVLLKNWIKKAFEERSA